MAQIIEAKAVITGEEKLSPILDKLAKKFDQVAKTAKGAEGIDKMAAALGKVQKEMAAIDKYTVAGKGFAAARENFNKAQIAVQNAAKAMREGQGDATKLEAAYRRAQSAVQSASRAFEAQKGAAIAAKRGLDQLGIAGGRIVAEQQRIAASVDRASAAMDRQARKGRILGAIGRSAGTAGMIAGPGILRATRDAVASGAQIQSEIVKLRAAGIPEADIQHEVDQSASLSAKYTNVKRSDILERYKELRSVLLHPDEATHLLEPTIRANSALNALDRSGHMAEGLQFAVKGAEVLGLAQDPKRFEAYLDAFIKAQQVMGKTITPEQMFEFAKYTKASGSTLSDRFKFTTGVSLSQEMGGSTTGVSIDQFVKQIVGGFQGQQHAAAKSFLSLGLVDREDFETTKTGEIKGLKPGHHVKGYREAMSDPDKWVYDYYLPALEKAGITDPAEVLSHVRRDFTSARAADLVSKLITQRPSFSNHAALYEKAQGLDAIGNNLSDPFVALNSLSTSLSSFAGTLTSPIMERAAGVLSSMASAIGGWGESLQRWQKGHETAAGLIGGGAVAAGAVGGGVLTYNLISGLMGGFGLKASALALDGSAAALMRAAAALGGGGVLTKGAAGAAGFGLGAAAVTLGVAGAALVASTSEAGGGEGDIYRRNPQTGAMELTEYGRAMQSGSGISGRAPIEAELKGSAEVKGEAKITIDIPGIGSHLVNVPLRGTVTANGPGSVGVSSPDAAAPANLGHR
jgi:hypothetical protein